jgi:hypothetical protein
MHSDRDDIHMMTAGSVTWVQTWTIALYERFPKFAQCPPGRRGICGMSHDTVVREERARWMWGEGPQRNLCKFSRKKADTGARYARTEGRGTW